jgi:type I restriction-modification system DNA methylase subunit
MKRTENSANRLAQLLQLLSYTGANGWVSADQFDNARAHRFELVRARDIIAVEGAFCWLSGEGASAISAPLVYIATATDRTTAQNIHRQVWSQGLVPFLIISTPDEVLICKGFSYTKDRWDQSVDSIDWASISLTNTSSSTNSVISPLFGLRASRLRSSLFWREHAIDVSGRVDQVILAGLSTLSQNLIYDADVAKRLDHVCANGLIGKMLYLYFLVDRGAITQAWAHKRGHTGIDLLNPQAQWSKTAFWKLLADLDSIFNGSIFPLSMKERAPIDATHIHLVKSVLKFGAQAQSNGAVQLGFIDVDLSVIRVETLSAVYEQFLENVQSGERRKVGAFYTPPFLVDLVLDRIEDEQPFRDGITVLDPSAGSGVFLVGAYRRILEHTQAKGTTSLTLSQVRGLLERNIFGVERNLAACHVAAFSLYLTMLDYVSPRDLSTVAEGKDPTKLFPGLVNKNLFARDFFDGCVQTVLPSIRCVVGNPPWQSLSKLDSPMGEDWAQKNPDCPIGNNQAAELFVWKALRNHLAEDGVLAMLIPSKSFTNPTAAKFRSHLLGEAYVTGAINLSHLRHKLFSNAKHPCAAFFLRKRTPLPSDWTWVYSPLSISQPVASKESSPWTLVMDQAEVQRFRHESLASNSRGWFEAFMLRLVDRQILQYVTDSAASGSISILSELCKRVGAKHQRGGSSVETGLPETILNADSIDSIKSDIKISHPNRDLFEDAGAKVTTTKNNDQLSPKLLAATNPNYYNQFSGNILLVPRRFRGIRFVAYPKAYSSSYLAVFYDKPANKVTRAEKRLLLALERYLKSTIALYFLATTGRRWLIDRSNIEPGDFGNLPLPFTSLDDERIDKVLSLEDSQLDNYLLNAFHLDQDQRSAIKEFIHFRLGFQDGSVPQEALSLAKPVLLGNYVKVFQRNLDGLVGRQGAFRVDHQIDAASGYGVVFARYSDDDEPAVIASDLTAACQQVIQADIGRGRNPFADSSDISIDAATSTLSIIKPLEYFRWTIDWAYADSHRAIDKFLRGAV